VWNEVISRCAGSERGGPGGESALPCYPSTVVYGHTASRGLDVHRWTVGIDTGCVCCTPFIPLSRSLRLLSQIYGRRLTALILDNAHLHQEDVPVGAHDGDYDNDDDDDDDDAKSSHGTVPFGDSGQARLFSIKCHKHKV
jgi:hypothetical protein